MDEPTKTTGLAAWWVLGILLVAVAQVTVSLVLFLPQASTRRKLGVREKRVQDQVEDIELAGAHYGRLEAQIAQARRALAATPIFQQRRQASADPMDVVAKAVGAHDVRVMLVEPVQGEDDVGAEDAMPGATESWKVRLKADVGALVAALSDMETGGVLLESRGFLVDATAEGETELEVVVRPLPAVDVPEPPVSVQARPQGEAAELRADEAAADTERLALGDPARDAAEIEAFDAAVDELLGEGGEDQ